MLFLSTAPNTKIYKIYKLFSASFSHFLSFYPFSMISGRNFVRYGNFKGKKGFFHPPLKNVRKEFGLQIKRILYHFLVKSWSSTILVEGIN